jgi:hypothetical protein
LLRAKTAKSGRQSYLDGLNRGLETETDVASPPQAGLGDLLVGELLVAKENIGLLLERLLVLVSGTADDCCRVCHFCRFGDFRLRALVCTRETGNRDEMKARDTNTRIKTAAESSR